MSDNSEHRKSPYLRGLDVDTGFIVKMEHMGLEPIRHIVIALYFSGFAMISYFSVTNNDKILRHYQ